MNGEGPRTDADQGQQRAALEALPRSLPVERIDRIWVFPVKQIGKKESGLTVISTLPVEEGAPRRVLTLRWEAERGRAGPPTVELAEQGSVVDDRVGRIVDGVIRRAGEGAGEPRVFDVAGETGRWEEVLSFEF